MQFHMPAGLQAQPVSLGSPTDHIVTQAFKVLKQLHSAVTQAQPQQPRQNGSKPGTAQPFRLFTPSITNSPTRRKTAFSSPSISNKPLKQTGRRRMLRRFPAPQVSPWIRALCTHHASLPEEGYATGRFAPSVRVSLNFSSISATCIWQPTARSGQPPPSRDDPRATSSFCMRGAGFPQCLQETEGAVTGFKVCATSLVRQSKRLQQLPAALGQICSRQRCEMGLASLSRSNSCCVG